MESLARQPAVTSWWDPLALVATMFLSALCYPLITVGLGFAPHLTFATLRALIAGVALTLVACVLKRPMPRGWRTWAALAAIGFSTTSLGFLGMFHAAAFVSPGLATVIANSQPLIAGIMAWLLLHERLSRAQAIGLFIGFLGIVVISLSRLVEPTRANLAVGVGYAAFAACGVAFGNVLMKSLAHRVDPLVAMATQTLLGAIPLAVRSLDREQPFAIVWSAAFIASLLGLALLGTAAFYWLWFTLLGRMPVSRANAFTFLAPFFGFALGVAFFGEHIGPAATTGLSLAAIGIVLVERGSLAPVVRSRE